MRAKTFMAMACAVICLSSVFAVSAFAAEAEIPDVEPTAQTAEYIPMQAE